MAKSKISNEYTLYKLSAMSHRSEVKIIENTDEHIVFVYKGKRKRLQTKKHKGLMIVKGWNQPVKVDSDFSSYMMDARMSFVGEKEDIINLIDSSEFAGSEMKTHSNYCVDPNGEFTPLFPDLYIY